MAKDERIGDLLVKAGMIDDMQLKSALGHQKRWGGKIGKALVDLGFIEEDTMLKFLSEHFKMKAVNLLRSRIAPHTFEAVPLDLARKYSVVPVIVKGQGTKKSIVLAMSEPADLSAIDDIQFSTGAKVEPVLATESAIHKVIQNYGNYSPEMAREYNFQESAAPHTLRKMSAQKPAPAPPQRVAKPAPPPPKKSSSRATPEEEDIFFKEENLEPGVDDAELSAGDGLEVVKGDVIMLKATKAAPKKPVARPAPSQPPPAQDADVLLGAKKKGTEDSPFLMDGFSDEDSEEILTPEIIREASDPGGGVAMPPPPDNSNAISQPPLELGEEMGKPNVTPAPLDVPPPFEPLEEKGPGEPPEDESSDLDDLPSFEAPPLLDEKKAAMEEPYGQPGPPPPPGMVEEEIAVRAEPKFDVPSVFDDPSRDMGVPGLFSEADDLAPPSFEGPGGGSVPGLITEETPADLIDEISAGASDRGGVPTIDVPPVFEDFPDGPISEPEPEPPVMAGGLAPPEMDLPPIDEPSSGLDLPPMMGDGDGGVGDFVAPAHELQTEAFSEEKEEDAPVVPIDLPDYEPAEIEFAAAHEFVSMTTTETEFSPDGESGLDIGGGSEDLGDDFISRIGDDDYNEMSMAEAGPAEDDEEPPELEMEVPALDNSAAPDLGKMAPESPGLPSLDLPPIDDSPPPMGEAPIFKTQEEEEDLFSAPPMTEPDGFGEGSDLWGGKAAPSQSEDLEWSQGGDSGEQDIWGSDGIGDESLPGGSEGEAEPPPPPPSFEAGPPPGFEDHVPDFLKDDPPAPEEEGPDEETVGLKASEPEEKKVGPLSSLPFEGPPPMDDPGLAGPDLAPPPAEPKPAAEEGPAIKESPLDLPPPPPPEADTAKPKPIDNVEEIDLGGDDPISSFDLGSPAGSGDVFAKEEPVPPPAPEIEEPKEELKTEPPPAAAKEIAPKPVEPEVGDSPELLGEFKQVAVAADDEPESESTLDQIEKMMDMGDAFLDTSEVKMRLQQVARLEVDVKEREYQFDELLNLMMKKEMGEITQELFMKELKVLKAKVDETRESKKDNKS